MAGEEVSRIQQFLGAVTAGVEAYRSVSAPSVVTPTPGVAPAPPALPTAAPTPPPTIKTAYGMPLIGWPIVIGLAAVAALVLWR